VVGWLVARGLPVSAGLQDGLTALISGGAIVVWYAGVRWLERRWPAFGWLLGVAKVARYPKASASTATQPHAAPLTD
jgi:hypothetical protein